MNTYVEKLEKSAEKSVVDAVKARNEELKVIAKFRDVIEQLPENAQIFAYNFGIVVNYYPMDNTQAEGLRGQVQLVTGAIAQRHINSNSGDVSYQHRLTRDPYCLEVIINKGELAPGCKLVAKQVMKTVYESHCDSEQGSLSHS